MHFASFVKLFALFLLLISCTIEVSAYLKKPCRDIAAESTCWLLYKRGHCHNETSKTKIYCRKTCGFCHTCEDYLFKEKCTRLTLFGACLHNHQKMKIMCPETCGFCPKNCKDKHSRCGFLRRYGACFANPIKIREKMHAICPDSCGKCKPKTACDDYFCAIGKKCHLRKDGTPYCVCKTDCSKVPSTGPVCLKNGQTYPHLCAVKKEECNTLSFIPISHYGHCNRPTASCVDAEREAKAGLCKQWKAIGACTNHVKLMKTYCKKTCGLCRVPRNPPRPKCLDSEFGCCWNGKDVAQKDKYGDGCKTCVDLRFCKVFQQFCGSKVSHDLMKNYCPLACGYCVPQKKHKIFEVHRARELARKSAKAKA